MTEWTRLDRVELDRVIKVGLQVEFDRDVFNRNVFDRTCI